MRKILPLLLALSLILALSACGNEDFAGSGTPEDPYRIGTAQELRRMAKLINDKETFKDYQECHYVLTADIDLSGSEWEPIGTYSIAFGGTLDGAGHTVSGMKINYSKPLVGEFKSDFGLFAEIHKGTVKNLTISDSSVTVKGDHSPNAGAIAGSLFQGTVENCHTTSSVKITCELNAGGIVGTCNSDEDLRDCTNAAAVTATSNVGQAAGITTRSGGRLLSCSNTGTITAEGDAAGIVVNATNSVMDCVNSGTVHGRNQAGGICVSFDDGALNSRENDSSILLTRCENSGEVVAAAGQAGGITAAARTGAVEDCVNSGAVTATEEVGGIIGYFQISAFGTAATEFRISGCENTGAVTSRAEVGNGEAGGIIGKIYSSKASILIRNCSNAGRILSSGQKDVLDSTGEVGGILAAADVRELRLIGCTNSGQVEGVAKAGGIAGSINAYAEEEQTLFLAENCHNYSDVTAKYYGGISSACYSGGIVGYLSQPETPRGAFDQVDFLNCSNSGRLLSDVDPFCYDDLCASDRLEEFYGKFA